MKVIFKNINKEFGEESIKIIKDFTNLLQQELPLKDDVHITFVSTKDEHMTTGVRLPNHNIHILSKNRLLIDVLRTLSHEWTHEYQHQKLGLKDTDKIQNIGGPEENMANVLSGIFVKKFDKKFPNYNKLLYEQLMDNFKERTTDDKVKEIILNATDLRDFGKALQLKYGKYVPLYHATTVENSKLIDDAGFKLTHGGNRLSFANEKNIYFQIGKSDYVATNRPVLYKVMVPISFILKYADADMDNVNIGDEELIDAGINLDELEQLPYEIKDIIRYFIWNDMKLDGMELLIIDRTDDIFGGLEIEKVTTTMDDN
jgi:hypothetical protein